MSGFVISKSADGLISPAEYQIRIGNAEGKRCNDAEQYRDLRRTGSGEKT